MLRPHRFSSVRHSGQIHNFLDIYQKKYLFFALGFAIH